MLVAEKHGLNETRSTAVELRAVRPKDNRQALGMAVGYLMTDPVFGRLPFAQWSRVLVGQVNRGHYLFAMEGGRVVGFVGWALTTKEKAEAWLTENRDVGFADSMAGEVVLINGWKASDSSANRFLVEALRRVIRDKEMVYAKRFYRDGRVRPMRLAVNAFVEAHIGRRHEPHAAAA
jgi:hemolysin-activating ACP:hemolysin acyltransferase